MDTIPHAFPRLRRARAGPGLRALAVTLLLGAALAVPHPATGAAGTQAGPRALVQEATARLFAAIEAQDDRDDAARIHTIVDRIVSPHVDYRGVARAVLPDHWGGMSARQRERFTEAFHELLIRTYGTAAAAYTGAEIRYTGTRVSGDGSGAQVRTEVRSGAKPVQIDYRLRRVGGEWKLVDLAVDGASLLSTYSRSFAAQIEEIGTDGLIERLIAKNAKSRSRASRG